MNGGAPYGHVPSGGTGFGVATLVHLVRGIAERESAEAAGG